MIGGALVALVGYAIPQADLAGALPVEFQRWREALAIDLEDASLIDALGAGSNRAVPPLLFVSFWLVLPLLLGPAAAALGWRRPSGVWDDRNALFRPLAWALVLFVPVAYALYVFNVMSANRGDAAVLMARIRLLMIATPLALWTQLGAAPLVHWMGSRGSGRSSDAPAA
jgi:hypothetical protein